MTNINDRAVDFFPEALDPTESQWLVWEIDARHSCVDLERHEAHIPRARTRASEQIRFHELAHVAYTDPHFNLHESEATMQICKMLEEIRIDTIMLKERGIDLRHRHDDFDWTNGIPMPTTPLDKALWHLQTAFHVTLPSISDDVIQWHKRNFDGMAAPLRQLMVSASQSMMGDTSRENRERLVKQIWAYFAPPPPKRAPNPGLAPKKEAVREEIIRQNVKEAEEEAAKKNAGKKVVPQPSQQEIQEERDKLAQKLYDDPQVGSFYRVGNYEVHDHIARTGNWQHVKAPFTRTGRGIVPEFMENYCIDKRIYRTDHRGGLLVIDKSGSMSWDFSVLTQTMQDFPNLVVISYSGVRQHKSAPGVIGRICIHAKKGRIDPNFLPEPGYHGSNDIDIEALEFGAKFKGPRIWLSDGYACGGQYYEDGRYTYDSNIAKKAREVMTREHYVRINTLGDALKWVTRSGPVEYYTGGICENNRNIDPTSKHYRRARRP